MPPQIKPTVVMEVLMTIQAHMDGIEARLEKQADVPPMPTPVVDTPVAPQVPSQPPRPREGSVSDMKITEFLMLKPPTFAEKDPNEDHQRFLDDSKKVCNALECSNSQKVKLIAYQLRGRADRWWQTWSKGRASDAPPIGWNEFKKDFRDQFITRSARDARVKEFESLRQGSGIVDESLRKV